MGLRCERSFGFATPSTLQISGVQPTVGCPFFFMWSPNNPDLANDGKSFLVAAWHELFYGFTPDSYQPRLHNVASLIDELVHIGSIWEDEPRYAVHVTGIQAELKEAIKGESRILSLIPTYRSAASALVSASSPRALVVGGSIAATQRETYWKAFETWATSAIAKLPEGKEEALDAIRRLATFAFQHGKEDDDVWDEELANTSENPVDIFRELVRRTRQSDQPYLCTLSILGETDEMHSVARRQGHEIVADTSLPANYRDTISTPGAKRLHVRLSVTAPSIRHAVAIARKQLGLEIGFVSLYKNPGELRLHSTALVTSGGGNRVFVQSEQAFRRLFPRSRARKDIKSSLELVSSHEIDGRVLAAVEQLALASGSTDTRTRLVNLWSALETLAGSHEGTKTIERISELIVPLVISRQVHKTTRYITILCQEFSVATNRMDYGSGFQRLKHGSIRLEDMLCTLTSPKDDPKIRDLLGFAEHPLMRFHILSTWKTFHSPKVLRTKLLGSKLRVEWQLARIYRARNLLVHEGLEVPHIVPLLDNLQNYSSMLVQRLVHELKTHSDWNVRHSIAYWNSRMNHVIESLERCPECLTAKDFLETKDSTQVWPSFKAKT